MSYFTASFNSKAVGGSSSVSIILPIGTKYEDTIAAGEKFQTLWLLHGGGGSSSEWARMTDIERLAINHKIAVVMPEVGSNFYSDMPDGPQYFTYVADELPNFLRKHFPLSEKREDNFVAGLSMGGFGAAKCAFNYPERYGAVGLMSTGPVNPIQLIKVAKLNGNWEFPTDKGWFDRLFGGEDKIPGSANDIWYLLEQSVKKKVDLPLIYDCCGTEDFYYPGFAAFKRFAKKLGLEVTFAESSGCHSWDFWFEHLGRFLDWLPLLKNRDYLTKFNIDTKSSCAPYDNSYITEEMLDSLNV